jgi:excisionase family DNA binding protein
MEQNKKQEGAPFSLEEAADYLGLARSFLYKLTSQGHYKPGGGRLYFRREDLDAYLFRGRRTADFVKEAGAEAFLAGARR